MHGIFYRTYSISAQKQRFEVYNQSALLQYNVIDRFGSIKSPIWSSLSHLLSGTQPDLCPGMIPAR